MSKAKKMCSVSGCGEKQKAIGLCSRHYQRQRTHGSPMLGGTIHGTAMKWIEEKLPSLIDANTCINWPFGKTALGYARLYRPEGTRTAHQFLCAKYHGPKPDKNLEVAHSCGNRLCVNPRHLRWSTHFDNVADTLLHGTRARGEKIGASKLTQDDVIAIRNSELSGYALAKVYAVNQSQISRIRTGQRWRWLPL